MIVLCNGNATPCCQAVSLTVIVSQCLREFLRLCGPRYVFRTRQCTSPLFRLSLGRWNARLGFSQLASRWASGAAVLGTGGCLGARPFCRHSSPSHARPGCILRARGLLCSFAGTWIRCQTPHAVAVTPAFLFARLLVTGDSRGELAKYLRRNRRENWAMRAKKRYRLHSGRSTGPTTPDGMGRTLTTLRAKNSCFTMVSISNEWPPLALGSRAPLSLRSVSSSDARSGKLHDEHLMPIALPLYWWPFSDMTGNNGREPIYGGLT